MTGVVNEPGYSSSDLLAIFTLGSDDFPIGEDLYGGDLRDDLASAPLCGLGLPAPEYEIDHAWSAGALASSKAVDVCGGEILSLVDNTIDVSTGLIRSSRDAAGVKTDYVYDPMDRVIAVKSARTAATFYGYELPTDNPSATEPTLTVSRCNIGSNACAAENSYGWREFTCDGLNPKSESTSVCRAT